MVQNTNVINTEFDEFNFVHLNFLQFTKVCSFARMFRYRIVIYELIQIYKKNDTILYQFVPMFTTTSITQEYKFRIPPLMRRNDNQMRKIAALMRTFE